MTDIRRTTVAHVATLPEFWPLIQDYANESQNPVLGKQVTANVEHYSALEGLGVLHALGAWRAGKLVGVATVLTSRVPHHDKTLCIMESLFVHPSCRAGGLGIRLIQAAEELAAELGDALFVTAPPGGALMRVIRRLGYSSAGATFVKPLR